jgi:hypothetical protein
MTWKKLLLIAAVAGAFTFAAAPQTDAGVRVGIGIGLPVGYPAYGYPYYPYGYPYAYAPYYPYGYYPGFYGSTVVFSRPVSVVHRGHPRVVHHHHRPHR